MEKFVEPKTTEKRFPFVWSEIILPLQIYSCEIVPKMANIDEVTEAFNTTYGELITELQRTKMLPSTRDFRVPTPKEFYETATTHNMEEYLLKNDPQVFTYLVFETTDGKRGSMKRVDQYAPEMFIYLKNLLLLATTLNSSVDFDRLQRNLESMSQAENAASSGLMSIINDVQADIGENVSPEALTAALSQIDLKNPASILTSLSESGVDIYGIINKVSENMSDKISNGQINPEELQTMMSSILASNMPQQMASLPSSSTDL